MWNAHPGGEGCILQKCEKNWDGNRKRSKRKRGEKSTRGGTEHVLRESERTDGSSRNVSYEVLSGKGYVPLPCKRYCPGKEEVTGGVVRLLFRDGKGPLREEWGVVENPYYSRSRMKKGEVLTT